MNNKKKKKKEIGVITTSPSRRPYGAKITLLLEPHTFFDIDGECTFLVEPKITLRIKPKELPHIKDSKSWEVFVEGFSSATEAEQMGLKVAMGFLWVAIQGRYSARLLYAAPLPCTVYDRTISLGLTGSVYGIVTTSKGISNIVDPLNIVLSSKNDIDPRLLVALEIFASARLETTERAKFVGIVSAIEPLAIQEKCENIELKKLLASFNEQLNSLDIKQSHKNSLQGRIRQLSLESVSSAIKKLVEKCLPNDTNSLETIVEAYGLRSKILHEGTTDADLHLKSRSVEEVIKKILEVKINQFKSAG